MTNTLNTRPAPAATVTGLKTIGFVPPMFVEGKGADYNDIFRSVSIAENYTAVVTRSQAEELLAAERAEKIKWMEHSFTEKEQVRALEANLEFIERVKGVNEKYANALAFLEMTESDDPEEFAECFWNKFIALEADNAALAVRIKELEADVKREAQSSTHNAQDCLDEQLRAETLEAKLAAAEKALEPFAEYCGDHFDKDYDGNPLPDEQKVGWVYLNYGHFRKARAVMGGKS